VNRLGTQYNAPMDCLFCRIVAGEIPADIVYQDERAVAFRDVNPVAPVHVLVVPRKHIRGVDDVSAEDEALAGHLLRVAAEVASREEVQATGFRCVVNVGGDAGQSVSHLHVHVLGGQEMGWPPFP